MSGADLVIAIGPDQQQVPHVRVRDQVLKEIQRCRIEPLQIVEEQCERVLLPRKDAKEAPENHLEAAFRVLRRQIPDRLLCADHRLQIGNEIHHELHVRAECLAQRFLPSAKLCLALAQERAHKALERLRQSGVRDVALVLVELARGEQAPRRHEHLVQLVHHRGLADPGIAGHQHEIGRAVGHDAVEGLEQGVDLALPPVQLLRDHQPIRCVLSAERERVDPAGRLP